MELEGCRIGVLVEDLFEDLELWYPVIRLREAGAKVMLLGTGKRQFRGKHGLSADADTTVDSVDAEELDGLLIPGGYAPDRLRLNEDVLELVREMDRAGKLLAFLCHAGSVLVSAGLLRNRCVTSYMSIRADLENAGAQWEDRSVVVDGNFISSRDPGDLPDFCRVLVDTLSAERIRPGTPDEGNQAGV